MPNSCVSQHPVRPGTPKGWHLDHHGSQPGTRKPAKMSNSCIKRRVRTSTCVLEAGGMPAAHTQPQLLASVTPALWHRPPCSFCTVLSTYRDTIPKRDTSHLNWKDKANHMEANNLPRSHGVLSRTNQHRPHVALWLQLESGSCIFITGTDLVFKRL